MFLLACAAPTSPPPSGVQDTGEGTAPVQCASPAAEVTYEEVGAAWGIVDTVDDEPSRREHGAVALADLDGDGDDDLVLAARTTGAWLQRTGGDALGAELVSDLVGIAGIAMGDVDRDRDLDLVLAGTARPVQLLLNDGTGAFAVSTLEDGVLASKRHAVLGDVDGDGDLDLFLTVAGDADRLYDNDGAGVFTDASDRLPASEHGGLGWSTALTDLDLDGDLDAYTVNADQAQNGPSRLLRNDGGVFTDVSDACYCAHNGNPMGASAADVSGDGWPDFFVTNTGANNLFVNARDGSFTDVAQASGATVLSDPLAMTFGAAVFDRDNDGWADILTTAGPLHQGTDLGQPAEQPDVLLDGGPDGWVDVAPALGLDDPAAGRGVAVGLLDEDGFLDLAVAHLGAPSQLHRATCTEARALVVDLAGAASDTYGIGARLVLTTAAGTQTREVTANAGWGSSIHPRAHFGLGDEVPKRLDVYWPSGVEQTVELGATTPLRISVAEP